MQAHNAGAYFWLVRALRLVLAFGAVAVTGSGRAADQVTPHRVLILYPYNNLYPVSVITGEAARKRMTAQSREPLELYSDFLDLGRFSALTMNGARPSVFLTNIESGDPRWFSHSARRRCASSTKIGVI